MAVGFLNKLSQLNNAHATLLASAARTAQIDTADQLNSNWQGALAILNVTAASGTGGLQVRWCTTDPVSGTVIFLNAAPTAVIAVGVTVYALALGLTAAPAVITQASNMFLPDSFRIRVQVGDASSYTYSVAVRYLD